MMFFVGKPVAEPNSNAIRERRTMARVDPQSRLARSPATVLQSGGHFLRHRPDRLVCGAMSWDSCRRAQQSDQIFNAFLNLFVHLVGRLRCRYMTKQKYADV